MKILVVGDTHGDFSFWRQNVRFVDGVALQRPELKRKLQHNLGILHPARCSRGSSEAVLMDAKPLPAGEISALDQEEAYMKEFARVLGSYYKEMLAQAIPEELAGELLVEYQREQLYGQAEGD
jgi:hypothetical protein